MRRWILLHADRMRELVHRILLCLRAGEVVPGKYGILLRMLSGLLPAELGCRVELPHLSCWKVIQPHGRKLLLLPGRHIRGFAGLRLLLGLSGRDLQWDRCHELHSVLRGNVQRRQGNLMQRLSGRHVLRHRRLLVFFLSGGDLLDLRGLLHIMPCGHLLHSDGRHLCERLCLLSSRFLLNNPRGILLILLHLLQLRNLFDHHRILIVVHMRGLCRRVRVQCWL
jgi:hypothetical protein